ncbi:MAG: glycosyltransferase family 39 protein [Candidatus Heimdallarchaeota archaeon]
MSKIRNHKLVKMNVLNNHSENNRPFTGNECYTKTRSKYTRSEKWIIFLTLLIVLLGFLLRTWRILREGMPIAFDGWYFQKTAKTIFFDEWYDLSKITRDPPGIFFILVLFENLLGLPGEPIMWSIFILPQIICSLQLVIFFVLARRLTHSRVNGLLTMFFMSFLGLIVYRNQNVAPETIVLGLVPYIVYFLYRYFETNDYRFLAAAIVISVGITLIHHLSTLFVLIIWHVLLPYDVIHRRIKKIKISLKSVIINFIILTTIDIFVYLFWIYVLNNYPIGFMDSAIESFIASLSISVSVILMIIGVLILNIITFTYLWFNFDSKRIKITIISFAIVGCILIFILAMFFGGTTPETSIWTAILAGTPILILPPLGSLGLVSLPNSNSLQTRIIKGWLFGLFGVISITAIIPMMSSILGRLALFVIPVGVLLATIGIMKIVESINIRKFKAIALIGLAGSMALTMTYAYPKPENNWGQQEIYYDAEFKAVDFLSLYVYAPNNTVFNSSCPITIDADLRLSLIIEGYGGLDATYGYNRTSWLTKLLFLENESLIAFVNSSRPTAINKKIDYIFISIVMMEDGYITDWANYGTVKDNWIIKFPDISDIIPLNPYLHRIYNNGITYLLYQS